MLLDQRASHAQTFNLFLDRLAAEKAKTVDGSQWKSNLMSFLLAGKIVDDSGVL